MNAGTLRQLPLGIGLKEWITFETFVPGPNGEAIACLQQGNERYAYLWGERGTGKSHLLQAACRVRAGTAAYLPLRELVALGPGVLEGLETLDLVCLDDLDQTAGDSTWEQALFVLYDRLRDAGGMLRVAGSAPPSELGFGLVALVSRLTWGPVYHLQVLGEVDRAQALGQRARARGLDLSEEVIRWLLRHYQRDNSSLFGLLDRLDEASLAAQRRLTLPFVRWVVEQDAPQTRMSL